VRSGSGVARARQAGKRGDADGHSHVAAVQGRDAQAWFERRREVCARCVARVCADGVGPGGGTGGGRGRPDRVAGENGLPGAGEEHGEDREKRHELDCRLAFFACERLGHGATLAWNAVAALRLCVANLRQKRHKTEFPPFGAITRR
jgi:hypothetical protein